MKLYIIWFKNYAFWILICFYFNRLYYFNFSKLVTKTLTLFIFTRTCKRDCADNVTSIELDPEHKPGKKNRAKCLPDSIGERGANALTIALKLTTNIGCVYIRTLIYCWVAYIVPVTNQWQNAKMYHVSRTMDERSKRAAMTHPKYKAHIERAGRGGNGLLLVSRLSRAQLSIVNKTDLIKPIRNIYPSCTYADHKLICAYLLKYAGSQSVSARMQYGIIVIRKTRQRDNGIFRWKDLIGSAGSLVGRQSTTKAGISNLFLSSSRVTLPQI